MAYTITYSPNLPKGGGWPSFYGYHPEMMVGMNSDFFSFKNGNINIHNSNDNGRARFYSEESTDGDTSIVVFTTPFIETVFNENPVEAKVYKALKVSGNSSSISSTMSTDMHSGNISSFEKKEDSYYSFINMPITDTETDMRFSQGIGVCNSNTAANSIQFDLPSINTMISIGDRVLSAGPLNNNIANTPPVFLGTITAITSTSTTTTITTTGGSAASANDFIYAVPNPLTSDESHGLTGHYMITKINMNSSSLVELYAVDADKMKSYP